MNDPIVIVSAARTPMGSFQGGFSGLTAEQSRRRCHQGSRRTRQASTSPTLIEEVLMGCVLPAGQGQAPARQAALAGRTAVVHRVAPQSTRSAVRR